MNLSKLILRIAGWRLNVTVPDYPKSIICVAPHTSIWDFILGKLAYAAVGRKAGFLMKESWFFFPLGCIFRAMGGIPVPRQKGTALTERIVERFNHAERLSIAITPEGTRKRTDKWRRGFLYIAYDAHIPVLLGAIDYRRKEISIVKEFTPTGDVDADLRKIKDYYKDFTGKYPSKFCTD